MPPSDPLVLDPHTMEQLIALDDGGLGLFLEMFQLFQEDTPGRIESMTDLLARGELNELADVAHAIKGAASTMGAMRLRVAAAAVETAGRKGEALGVSQDMLHRIHQEYDRAIEAMESFKQSQALKA